MRARTSLLILVISICYATGDATPIVLLRTPYGGVLATDSLQTHPNNTYCKPMFTKNFALVETTNMVWTRIRNKSGKIVFDDDPRTAYIQSLIKAKDITDAKRRIIQVAEAYFNHVLSYFVNNNAPEVYIAEQMRSANGLFVLTSSIRGKVDVAVFDVTLTDRKGMKFSVRDVLNGKPLNIGSFFMIWNTETIGSIPRAYPNRREYLDFATRVLSDLPQMGDGYGKPYVFFEIDKNGIELLDSGHVCNKV